MRPDPVRQGDIVWADLGEPRGSEPGYRRPVVVIQSDAFNRSRIATMLCIPLTSTMRLADMPGNVQIAQGESGLDRDSVANVSLLTAIDKICVDEWCGTLPERRLQQIFEGLDLVLGR